MSIIGIPYDEMPRYIEQYREEIENLTKSALQLNEIVKEKQKIIDKAIEFMEADYINGKCNGLTWIEARQILDILKGSDSSEKRAL